MLDAEAIAEEVGKRLDVNLRQAVSQGVVDGVKQLSADTDFIDQVGEALYDRLSGHVRDDVSKSVGRKVLTWVSALLLAGALYFSAKAGLLK